MKNKLIGAGLDIGRNGALANSNPELKRYLEVVAPATLNVTFDPISDTATLKISEYPCSVRKTIPLAKAVLQTNADSLVLYLEDMRKELDTALAKERQK